MIKFNVFVFIYLKKGKFDILGFVVFQATVVPIM